jgi:hypothetical protein
MIVALRQEGSKEKSKGINEAPPAVAFGEMLNPAIAKYGRAPRG